MMNQRPPYVEPHTTSVAVLCAASFTAVRRAFGGLPTALRIVMGCRVGVRGGDKGVA
jgi:hypothetical protein